MKTNSNTGVQVEGNYRYNPAKQELKRIKKRGQKIRGIEIYSIRIGTKNPNICFFNHTDYEAITGACNKVDDRYTIYYQGTEYVFNLNGNKAQTVTIELKK